jgi:hypothetical protein
MPTDGPARKPENDSCLMSSECAIGLQCIAMQCKRPPNDEPDHGRNLIIAGSITLPAVYLVTLGSTAGIVADTCDATCRARGYGKRAIEQASIPVFGAFIMAGDIDAVIPVPSNRPIAVFGLILGGLGQVAGLALATTGITMKALEDEPPGGGAGAGAKTSWVVLPSASHEGARLDVGVQF